VSWRPRWPGWRATWRLLVGTSDSPHRLALAVALGALVAPTPVLGLHTWMAVGLAFLLRVNRLAAFLGSNLANPVTMAPIVWLDVRVGAVLSGREGPLWRPGELDWEMVRDLYLEAWLGAAVLGPLLALVSYLVTRALLVRARRSDRDAEA
jgi:uncharacterized protein (DUF2062 family)